MTESESSGSALRGVFGSSVSLAELSGDVNASRSPPSGYSRFGLNEKPPHHQMHTTVPRRWSASGGAPPRPRRPQRWLAVTALFAFGVIQGRLMNFHLPQGTADLFTTLQKSELLVFSGIIAVIIGFFIPTTDTRRGSVPRSPSLGSAPITQQALDSTTNTWFTSLVRSYGVLLGLVYLSHKLPREAILAWVLINPTMWYITDTTANGFIAASGVSLLGTVVTAWLFPQLLSERSGIKDVLFALAGTATAYFGTSLVAGNVGRGVSRWE